jgi:hypothetical protein
VASYQATCRANQDEPEIDDSTINELLAEGDSQSKKKLAEAASEGEFEETWNFDATEELLAPEDVFSSDDLKGKV